MVEKVIKAIEKKYPELEPIVILDLGDYYVSSLGPKNSDEGLNDGHIQIDKKTYKVSSFSPIMDMENFLKATKSPIYKKKT